MVNLQLVFPEIFISLSIMFLLILGVFKKRSSKLIQNLSLIVLLITAVIIFNETLGIKQTLLFNDSISNNIALGNPKASKEEIMEAAVVANASEFIEKLDQGYDTLIGEGGNMLSGGQKQRLSIARAVLKNPDILILDEATSALDTASEKLVQNALENLMKNRTSLVIAHRLSTIKKADLIVVLNQGKIIETGTHKELLKKDSAYKKLVQLQTF